MTRFTRRAALLALISTAIAAPMSAQTDSLLPHRGTWGAEAALFSHAGSLVRFSTPNRAWVLGLDIDVDHAKQTSSVASPLLEGRTSSSSFRGQFGHRWYVGTAGADARRLRATYGLGLSGGVAQGKGTTQTDFHYWSAGGYGELGATWFFTRHFSVGAVSLLQVEKKRNRATSLVILVPNGPSTPVSSTVDSWSVSGNLFRVLGAVYF